MNLDWKSIKEKYPKAFNELLKDHQTIEAWGEIDSPTIWDEFVTEEHWVMRHLFDFFDSREIMIEIGVDFTRATYGTPLFCFSADYFKQEEHKQWWSELYRTRKEAEIASWEYSFDLLEKKL